jgi:hypothetical protein
LRRYAAGAVLAAALLISGGFIVAGASLRAAYPNEAESVLLKYVHAASPFDCSRIPGSDAPNAIAAIDCGVILKQNGFAKRRALNVLYLFMFAVSADAQTWLGLQIPGGGCDQDARRLFADQTGTSILCTRDVGAIEVHWTHARIAGWLLVDLAGGVREGQIASWWARTFGRRHL